MSSLSGPPAWSRALVLLILVPISCGGRLPPLTEAPSEPDASKLPPPDAPKWRRASRQATVISEGEYILPPPEVVRLLETESPPVPVVHNRSRRLVQLYEQQLREIEQTSRPTLGLAGLRIDGGNLTLRDQALYTRFDIRVIPPPTRKPSRARDASKPRVVRPPEGALFGGARFSPSGDLLAISLVYSDRVGVGIYDCLRDELTILEIGTLSRIWDEPCAFHTDEELLCSRPLHSGEPPDFQTGPKINELKAGAIPTLAYSNLLRDSNDDSLFEHYASIQPITVGIDGTVRDVLPAQGVIVESSLSPDQNFLLTSSLQPPYSRLLPADKMQRRLSVHDLTSRDEVLSIEPGPESSGTGPYPLGSRSPAWQPNQASTLVLLQRQKTSQGRVEDQLVFHTTPFSAPPNRIVSDFRRVQAYGWTSEGTLYVTDSDSPPGSWVSYLVRGEAKQAIKRGGEDRTGDPTRALRVHGDRGPTLEYKSQLYFAGDELPREGTRPRLLSFNLRDASTEILWRSGQSEHAQITAILDPRHPEYLLRAETPTRPPSFSVTGPGPRRRVTEPSHVYEDLKGVRRHLIRYRRADGAMLSAMLYLPPDFKTRSKIPTVLWIYPRGVEDFNEASLSTEEPHRYFRVNGPSRFALLTQGYALVDAPSMPIIGRVKSGTNDFIPQLKQSAEAVIDHLVRLGVSDRTRIAVMGRSYGAFGTANLMVHSDLFKTGIAMSGAYNRTLTPFGFQSETQTFWQNTEAYVNMSPFFFADQLKGSLLLIHGELDDNPGTPVLQSERFHAALVGNGIPSRYVSFPFEGHQFRGRQAVLHSAAEIVRWLDIHLKGKKPD